MAHEQELVRINRELREVKRALRNLDIPNRLLAAVETRALRSGRRQTGLYRSNRTSRWRLHPEDPQYSTEVESKMVLMKLLGTMLQFDGAPAIPKDLKLLFSRSLSIAVEPGTYRDPLTLEKLDFQELMAELTQPLHGRSLFHLGHREPSRLPKHTPDNVEWRSARSNLIQGDLTLRQARAKFVELIARYLELGEISIVSEEEGGESDSR